jgi:anion-transporting  ArsA/GET3 family ATPase
MQDLNALLKDPQRTEFVCVCIATDMAVAESERLIASLRHEGIKVASVVVNQLIGPTEGSDIRLCFFCM